MKITNQMMGLISAIEYEIGRSCYNGHSYNGWTDEYGCNFRYPIVYETMVDGKAVEHRTRHSIKYADITPENLRTVCYQFGANELCIGRAVINVLNLLENRYGLDFCAMEEVYQAEQAKENQ